MGQSTNDVFPTAIHVAVARLIRGQLLPALRLCGGELLAGRPGVAGRAEDRAHAPDRRHAAGLGPGDRRHGPATGPGRPTGGTGPGGPAGIAGGRHGGGQRHQHAPRIRPPRVPDAGQGNRVATGRSGRSFRGQCPARRPGRVSRAAAGRGRYAVCRGQQHPLAEFRPANRLPRDPFARPPARQLDHARQGESGDVRRA